MSADVHRAHRSGSMAGLGRVNWVEWVEEFYSVTGAWWGEAEAPIGPRDRARARYIEMLAPTGGAVLELGCGYGSTAAAVAEKGFSVTGIDVSARLDFAAAPAEGSGPLRFVRGDFYEVELDQVFAVVCYWDGFGVGSDEDQRRLLRRIATEWLDESGVAVIEVFNPVAWATDAGVVETIEPDVNRGYRHRLGHRRAFDRDQCVAHDTWWVEGSSQEWTQSLRCYSPPDLDLLLEGTGLFVDSVATLGDPTSNEGVDLGTDSWSYVATLRLTQVSGGQPTNAAIGGSTHRIRSHQDRP